MLCLCECGVIIACLALNASGFAGVAAEHIRESGGFMG
jgi:hypothetical protein